MNQRLRKYLESLGLPENATDQQAEEFMLQLEGKQLAYAKSLLDGQQAEDDEDEDEEEEDEEGQAEGDDDDEEEQADDDEEDRQTAGSIKAERQRVSEIYAIARRFDLGDKWARQQAEGGATIADVRKVALKKIAETSRPLRSNAEPNGTSSGVTVGDDRNRSTLELGIHDAIMLRSGVQAIPVADEYGQIVMSDETVRNERGEFITKVKTRRPHERAREFRGLTLHEMARNYLTHLGIQTTGLGKVQVSQLAFNRNKLMQLGAMQAISHTTSDFPSILENIATKTLRMAYAEAPRTWPIWCRRVTAPDFKDISRTQLGAVPTLRKVNEGGEIKHVTIGDAKQVYHLATYAEQLTLTWQALVNDDLDAFLRIPQLMGNAATRREEDLVYLDVINANVMADGNPIFHTDNGNLVTGASSGAPSVDQLNAAYAAMQKQTGLAGEILDIVPAFLIAPSDLRGDVLELLTSQVRPGTNEGHTRNIWEGELTPVTTARLSQESTDAWYLAASTNQIDTVEVCFLEEEQQPVIEEEEGWNVLGRKFRVRHSVAAACIDYRGLYKDAGTGS